VHVLPGEYWGVLSDSTRGDYTSWVAPEVLDRSDAADAVSEVFELGTFLFRLLTGESPIPGKTVRARIMSSLNGLRLKLRERLPSAPAELEAVFDRALESDPADRYRSVEAFRKALQSVAHLV
jgi:serine/threonine-protein kinase